jgi:pimeloyl-ACP methyl ester carboxylesterase
LWFVEKCFYGTAGICFQAQIVLENLETKKIVLVHGEGFGAWCWYKTISHLEEAGLEPVALDLTGSGIDHTDTNSIATLADYSKPLIDYLDKLPEDEKVILVGHSCGGASVSYALEHCPKKISKAVFLTATMVKDGQRPFDVFSEELRSADVFLQESQFLVYGNGKDKPPTGLMFDKQQIKGLYFNQTPSKDMALAAVSMRPIPLAPIMEKLSLTPEKYGTVRRYFIQTLDDHMLSPDAQEKLVRENPPDGIFKIKGGDHCPFFSKPQSLNKILLEIAQIQAPAALLPGKASSEEPVAEKS